MQRLKPKIEVSVNGKSVAGAFYSRLVSARIEDAPGQESDSCELVFDDAGNEIEMPPAGGIIQVQFGFEDGGAWKMGTFEVEKPTISGDENGELLTLTGRSAATAKDLKEAGSEHFDEETIGGIVEALAGRHGYKAKVSPELAPLKLPYIARVNQSPTDFLTRLADAHGALFSVKGGKFLFMQRGWLPPITVDKGMCESWTFEVEPRARFEAIETSWFDRSAGRTVFETHSTGLKGPLKRVREPFNSQAEAKAAARSEAARLGRATGTGSLTLAGMPEVMADAPILTTGFRKEANGLWRAASVTHSFEETYMTTIQLEAPEEGKE